MTTSTAPHVTQAQALPGSITVTLMPAARRGLRLLQEHTGLSRTDLANCAITWYAFDAQLRAGYHLTLRNDEMRKAYTSSLPAGSQPATRAVRWPPDGEGSGAESGTRAALGIYFNTAWLSQAQASDPRHGRLPGPVATPAQPWLTIATSRGSPAAPAAGGGGRAVCRPDTGLPTRQRAAAGRNGGPS
jgi:hypothetical protein